MNRLRVALQPGGFARATRVLALLDHWPEVEARFLCGRRDGERLAATGVEADAITVAADDDFTARVARAASNGDEAIFLDADLDAVPTLCRAPLTLATDDAPAPGETPADFQRARTRLEPRLRSTDRRIWWGEIAEVELAERRVWLREQFREAGFVTELARREPPADPPDDRDRVLVVHPRDRSSWFAEAGAALARVRGWTLLEVEDSDRLERRTLVDELVRCGAAVVPAGRTLLATCAGLGTPTLCRPDEDARSQARAAYFEGRLGITIGAGEPGPAVEHFLSSARAAIVPRPDRSVQLERIRALVETLNSTPSV